jgi:hypothetical protein
MISKRLISIVLVFFVGCGARFVYGATCGNGICEAGETPQNCSIDCVNIPTCGNGICESGENTQNCSIDCRFPPTCGNGICESGESPSNCSIDCGGNPTCGNGICESGETPQNCSIDCKSSPTCGNGICEAGESPSNCCTDCYQAYFSKACFDGDVYWYDCRGVRTNKAIECGTSDWANEYMCSLQWVQRKYIERGCSNAQCYETSQWRNYQYCSNYCSNGKCISPPGLITKGVVITY